MDRVSLLFRGDMDTSDFEWRRLGKRDDGFLYFWIER